MVHVALDMFNMPRTLWEGVAYDAMAVCVDRHSGWIVAIPGLMKGWTGAKVAQAMLEHQWRPFGIPSVVATDQGSHFASAWWQTMNARLGMRHTFSQAYHHQANGRAERAGQQLMERLRKMHAEREVNWVEAMPRTIDRIHDMPGESGLSPYEIVFGRHRPLAAVPYEPPRESECANQFFDRQKAVDEFVAKRLNEIHARDAERINQSRDETSALGIGDIVMYRRPENSADKLDTRWLGPAKVVGREGQRSYVIEVKPGVNMKAHRSFLKIYPYEDMIGEPLPMFYHQRTVSDVEATPDEWVVERILGHKEDPPGNKLFLTRWKGFGEEDDTWEPVGNFIHRYASDFVKYCKDKGLKIDVVEHLRVEPDGQME